MLSTPVACLVAVSVAVVVVVPQCRVASLMTVDRLTSAYYFEYSWLVMLEVSCRCCSGVVAVKMGPSLSSGLSGGVAC